MSTDRETVFAALFALVDGISWPVDPLQPEGNQRTFLEVSRRVKLFDDCQQPYLGQAEHNEHSSQVTGMPYKWKLTAHWLIYHDDGKQPGAVPATTNNLIMAAVEAALEPKPCDPGYFDERNTLSGLVHHCYIDGTVIKDPGDIDNQALISVPISILVP